MTAVLTIGAVNPFGFYGFGDFLEFSVVSRLIKNMYYDDVSSEDYVNGAISGFAHGTGDPYTNYIYGEAAQEYMDDVSGSFDGIGVYIENNTDDNTITVVSAISGTPAEEAGLVSGDKILEVAGESYTGEQINEAVRRMKGETGTTVDISVLKAESGEIVDLTLERRHIDVQTVESKLIEGTNIGYISISQFTETTGDDFEENLTKVIGEGAKSIVLDLRNNPGGYVTAAVEVASKFVDRGSTIVYTLDKNNEKEEYKSEGSQYNLPIVVLINQGSASASEIVAGALRDYDLAYIIGEQSYGKGIVQSVFSIGENIISVTIARYYTPNGDCIHDIGIAPDESIEMELSKYSMLDRLTLEQDEQLAAAVNYLNSN
ncbi:MAG TPA: PDZ domain-containing protein [Candidatus Monoglobus merdigallinarum]|uniref:PDZ domain-containing protein n=1 Tax=Candidatus Monoglobus merdigallinarum TaxID=2838698 RepID=A0A9D1PRX7_9FIRM|nr:PDZ domain-containing protein [Candidatus Monoglobus merdigallinarum]